MAKRENNTTDDLMNKLEEAASLERFLREDVHVLPPFDLYVEQLCLDRGEKREHVIKRAAIDRTYGHQLFNGTRKPSRDKVIQLAFGFGLDVEETQQLLRAAQKSPLYPRIKRDAAIIYCIIHGLQVADAQQMLSGFNLPVLGSQ